MMSIRYVVIALNTEICLRRKISVNTHRLFINLKKQELLWKNLANNNLKDDQKITQLREVIIKRIDNDALITEPS